MYLLEEAGEENISSALNAVSGKFQTISRREVLMAFEHALRNLYRQKLIDLCVEIQNQGRQFVPLLGNDAAKVLAVGHVLKWDDTENMWYWDKGQYGEQIALITLTDKGEEALRS